MIRQESEDLRHPRVGETFDEARLADFLSDKLEGADQNLRVLQFGGGMANLTYLLKFGESHEYVYRRPPMGDYAPSAHDMSREYRVLSRLHDVFMPAPRVYLYVDESDVMGAPFVIMERRNGAVIRRTLPDHYAQSADAPRQISETLVDVLVEFHAVDYDAIGLSQLGRPEGFITRQVKGWIRRWDMVKLEDKRDVDLFCAWLLDNIPDSSHASLVHNDYKLDNTIFANDDPSKLVAVLDWDMCTLGDPLLDLGTLLTYWTEPDDPPHLKLLTPMPTERHGFLTRREIIKRYTLKSGRQVDDIRFYHVLGLFRWLVYFQQMYSRYVHGQTSDQRFRALNEAVEALAKTAVETSRGAYL